MPHRLEKMGFHHYGALIKFLCGFGIPFWYATVLLQLGLELIGTDGA